jgi:hypothetical protein
MSHARALRSDDAACIASRTSPSAPCRGGREVRTDAGTRPVRRPLPGADAPRRARLARRRSTGAVPQRRPGLPGSTWIGYAVRARVRLQRPGGAGIGTELATARVAQPAVLLPPLHDLQTGSCGASAGAASRATRWKTRIPSTCAWLRATRNRRLLVVEPHLVLLAPGWHPLRGEPALLRAGHDATVVSAHPSASAGGAAATTLTDLAARRHRACSAQYSDSKSLRQRTRASSPTERRGSSRATRVRSTACPLVVSRTTLRPSVEA